MPPNDQDGKEQAQDPVEEAQEDGGNEKAAKGSRIKHVCR